MTIQKIYLKTLKLLQSILTGVWKNLKHRIFYINKDKNVVQHQKIEGISLLDIRKISLSLYPIIIVMLYQSGNSYLTDYIAPS